MENTLSTLDELISEWPTKLSQSDFLSKRLKQVSVSIEQPVNLDLLGSNHSLVETLQSKSKANDGTPIAYNLFLVTTQLKSLYNRM